MQGQFRKPPQQPINFGGLIIDNFAGGGGASTGIEMALGRAVDIAINHDPEAIAMHETNHPHTKHYCESVWEIDPRTITQGKPVDLAWFSPDCKHFSKAKGSKPRNKNIRGLAWVALRYAATVKPRVIMLENVEEFTTWGPLNTDGEPCPKNKGRTFNSFVNALRRQGYAVEWRELRACDFGAPTIRKRLFLIARCDGQPINWPQPTHGHPDSPEVKSKKLKPYRTAADIIDWSLPCPSIFDRKRPLAENTLKRIARGLERFVLNNPNPFVIPKGFITEHANASNQRNMPLDAPLRTLCAEVKGGHFALVTPVITKFRTNDKGCSVNAPLPTVTANSFIKRPGGAAPIGLAYAYLAKHFGGNYTGPGASVKDPLPTVTTIDHSALVQAFLIKYYGTGEGQALTDPAHTVTTKDRLALVTVKGVHYQIVDIGMRMLAPHELYAAQGFPKDYIHTRTANGKPLTKTSQVRMCGNSVCPPMASALVAANLNDQFQQQAA